MAFFVGLYDNLGPITDHADIVFDRVITNIGSGYDRDTGRFTAPVNGTFQFNVIVSAQGRQKANTVNRPPNIHIISRFTIQSDDFYRATIDVEI